MIYAQAIELSFDAGHTVEGEDRCKTAHGHHWVCVATISSDGSPLKQSDVAELRTRLDEIGRILNRRDLNAMLPGTVTNTTGVANWLYNQLSAHVPLIEVRVSADGASSVVRK
jgi:6-pyruvoyl-tetrahydropterin synthase